MAISLSIAAPFAAHSETKALAKKPEKPALVEAYRPGFAGSFLSSRFAKNQQDLRKASELADKTLEVSPKGEAFVMDAIRVHLLAGNIEKAQKLAAGLPEIARKEPMIAMLLALDAFEKKNFSAASSALKATADMGLLGVIKPALLAWIQLAAQGEKGPVPEQQEAINKSGFFEPFLHYQQALMHDVVGDSKNALKQMNLAVADPSTAPYRVVDMLTRMYVRSGQLEQAQKTAQAFNNANPDAVFSIVLPAKNAPAPVMDVTNSTEGIAELFFTTASILFGEEISTETLAYLRLALHLQPNFAPAQFMLAHVYEQQKDYEHAISVYDSIQSGNVFHERGQLRKALNLEALGEYAKASELLDMWAKSHPNDISAFITKADMLREQKRYEDAAAMYSQVLDRVKTPQQQHWPIYYTRGICYERTGQWNKAEADFKQALALEPDQPDVLNYLAYSWLTMGKNLQQAREYLQIAVAARPEDAHIIDSMGWAHYIAGDFDKAVEYLERAMEITPDDASINDHLGDAYWRGGRVLEARYQWKRALGNKPDKLLRETIESKLTNGLSPFLRQRGNKQMTQPQVPANAPFRESGTLPLTP